MFGIFKKKTEKEKLQETYNKLLKRHIRLLILSRTHADKIMAEAEEVGKKIDLLK
jgi:hypothetical protein